MGRRLVGAGSEQLEGTFFTDETTAAAAGYPGFDGYTVFTGGSPLTPP